MKFVSSVILVSIFCSIQQFSQILCDDAVLNTTSANASANDTGCEGVFCILDKIISFIEGSSGSSDGYDYYYDGNNSGYDDYYYDMGSPVVEEIIIVPVPANETAFENLTSASWPSSAGWDYDNYNASSSPSESSNDNSTLWSSLGGLFSNDGALGGLFGSGSSSGSGSASAINITSPSTISNPSASASSTSAPSTTTTTTTSAPPSSSSGSDYGSGSGFSSGSSSGSGSGSSASSSGGAISTSAPSTSAPAANTTGSANTTAPDDGTMTIMDNGI